MRKIIGFLALNFFIAPFTYSANALWNAEQGFGIWIYNESGTCQEMRTKSSEFIVVTPPQKIESETSVKFEVKNLKLCSLFKSAGEIEKCAGGYIELKFDKAKQEYSGRYFFSFPSAGGRKANFSASFCKPGQ